MKSSNSVIGAFIVDQIFPQNHQMATSATKQFKMANVQIKFEIGGTNCLAGERYIVRRMTEKVVDEVSVERNMVMETDVPSLDKMEQRKLGEGEREKQGQKQADKDGLKLVCPAQQSQPMQLQQLSFQDSIITTNQSQYIFKKQPDNSMPILPPLQRHFSSSAMKDQAIRQVSARISAQVVSSCSSKHTSRHTLAEISATVMNILNGSVQSELSYKRISDKVIEVLHVQCQAKQQTKLQGMSTKQQKTIRRRVYDVLNVLFALRVLTRLEKRVVMLPIRPMQEFNKELLMRKKIERLQEVRQQCKEKERIFKQLKDSYDSMMCLRKRNKEKLENIGQEEHGGWEDVIKMELVEPCVDCPAERAMQQHNDVNMVKETSQMQSNMDNHIEVSQLSSDLSQSYTLEQLSSTRKVPFPFLLVYTDNKTQLKPELLTTNNLRFVRVIASETCIVSDLNAARLLLTSPMLVENTAEQMTMNTSL